MSRSATPVVGAVSAFLIALLAVGLLVVGAVAWLFMLVFFDDPDDSPSIQRIEAEHSAMADLTIDSAKRTDRNRNGGEPGFLSYSTGIFHVQRYEPRRGHALADVADEIIAVAVTEGYVMQEGDGVWCALSMNNGIELRYPLEITIETEPSLSFDDDFTPHVRLALSGSCRGFSSTFSP